MSTEGTKQHLIERGRINNEGVPNCCRRFSSNIWKQILENFLADEEKTSGHIDVVLKDAENDINGACKQ